MGAKGLQEGQAAPRPPSVHVPAGSAYQQWCLPRHSQSLPRPSRPRHSSASRLAGAQSASCRGGGGRKECSAAGQQNDLNLLPLQTTSLCIFSPSKTHKMFHVLGNFDLDVDVVVSVTVTVDPGNSLPTHPNLLVRLNGWRDLPSRRKERACWRACLQSLPVPFPPGSPLRDKEVCFKVCSPFLEVGAGPAKHHHTQASERETARTDEGPQPPHTVMLIVSYRPGDLAVPPRTACATEMKRSEWMSAPSLLNTGLF